MFCLLDLIRDYTDKGYKSHKTLLIACWRRESKIQVMPTKGNFVAECEIDKGEVNQIIPGTTFRPVLFRKLMAFEKNDLSINRQATLNRFHASTAKLTCILWRNSQKNVKNTNFVPKIQISLISVESFDCFMMFVIRKIQTNLNWFFLWIFVKFFFLFFNFHFFCMFSWIFFFTPHLHDKRVWKLLPKMVFYTHFKNIYIIDNELMKGLSLKQKGFTPFIC